MIKNCKEYDATNGYNYSTFFILSDINDNKSDENIVNLKLGVLATKDAHILLSDKLFPTSNDSVYEFVLGAGANTFCEVRKKQKKSPLKPAVSCKLFTSTINPVLINIIVKSTGQISIYVIGKPEPLIQAEDIEPVAVKYVSFGSWGNAESKWFYDCKMENTQIDGTEIRAEKKVNTIRRQIMERYDMGLSDILIDFNVEMILLQSNFIAKNSVMNVRSKFVLSWFDPLLSWNQTEYNDVKIFKDTIPGWQPVKLLLLK